MKKYIKELVILIIQLLMFYLFPMFAGPTDAMGMVIILLFVTFVLAFILGIISNSRIKYLYPVIVSIIFIPSVYIYYNDSALVHAIWYFVISIIGLGIGFIIYKIKEKISENLS